jgi:hypothetical protein
MENSAQCSFTALSMACLNLAFLLRFFLHFCWQPQNRGPVRTDPLIGGVTSLYHAVVHRADRTAGFGFGSVNRPGWLGSVDGIITLSGRRPRAGLSAGVADERWLSPTRPGLSSCLQKCRFKQQSLTLVMVAIYFFVLQNL